MTAIRRHWWKATLPAGGLVLLLLVAGAGVEAHKGVISKYTYNDQVFPILRDRCGQCHVEGGPSPMSLVAYGDAFRWAEAIREELVSESMPPWHVDPDGPAVKGGYGISAKELDVLLTWATGGTPRNQEGNSTDPPPFTPNLKQWKSGPPDLAIPMEAASMLAAGIEEDIRDFTVATGLAVEKWIAAVDLLPGTPSMVRDAVISLENGPELAAWQPGDELIPAPNGVAFHLPAGAKLHLRMHYKKNWKDQGEALSDRSTLGLYFTERPSSGRALASFAVKAPEGSSERPSSKVEGTLNTAVEVVALRPAFDQPYGGAVIEAALPNGERVELLRLRGPRPQWYRRYWLVAPVKLPKGTKVTLAVTSVDRQSGDAKAPTRYPLQVNVDYVAQ